MNDLIKQDRDAGVLTLTFDRPDKLNALNNAMYTQLADLLQAADEDPAIGVVIITGGDNCFTSGNDLVDFLQYPPTHLDSPAFHLMKVVTQLQTPLIAAVCGAAIGIGTTLLLHCDQVVVSRNAKLRMPFVNIGLCRNSAPPCCCRGCLATPALLVCCCWEKPWAAPTPCSGAWPTNCARTARNA